MGSISSPPSTQPRSNCNSSTARVQHGDYSIQARKMNTSFISCELAKMSLQNKSKCLSISLFSLLNFHAKPNSLFFPGLDCNNVFRILYKTKPPYLLWPKIMTYPSIRSSSLGHRNALFTSMTCDYPIEIQISVHI